MRKLENWRVVHGCLLGQVYGDIRFKDGEPIITTQLVSVDFEKLTAKTKNSEYSLGVPYKEGTVLAKGELK